MARPVRVPFRKLFDKPLPLKWHRLHYCGRERSGSQFGIRVWKRRAKKMMDMEDMRDE